jgi:lysozyme family protein
MNSFLSFFLRLFSSPSPEVISSGATVIDIKNLIAANQSRWLRMTITASLVPTLNKIAQRLLAAKARYLVVDGITSVPWWVVAVIHERESSQSWQASLAQGDPWNKVSTHIPVGRGPFTSWEAAAEDALVNCPPHASAWTDWSAGGALTLLEKYNGLGYANRGRSSPYVWASTDQYTSGKYVSDGHYDPAAIDHQLGCAALLASMKAFDTSIPI